MFLSLLKKYTVNYFVWWYIVKGGETLLGLKRFWLYIFMRLNIGPMIVNIFRPLYQDPSITGRFIAFPIRISWVFFGSIIQVIAMLLSLIFVGVYFLSPLVVIIELIWYLFL